MRKFFSLMMATLFCVVLWAQAPAGTTLFSENFGGYAANDVPSGSVSSLEGSRVIYGGGSVTYTSVDNGKNITKIYAEALASGTSPELLVGKSGGVFTVAGIPSGNAQEITVSFKQNAQKLTVSLAGTGYSTEYASPKPSAAGEVTFDVTVADGADATFSLIMTAGSSNVRVDDILVTVKTASESAGGGDDPQPATRTIYFNGGGSSLWNQADAVFFVHAWGGTEADVLMTLVEGDVYSAAIPSDNTSLLFVRMAPGSEAINWDTKWNQSTDQTIPADKDLFTMTDWSNGTWSVYGETPEPPTPVEAAYYLVGSMNNWQAAEAYKFAPAEAEGEYILHTTLAVDDEIKVIKVEGETTTWYPAEGGNYVVDAAHAGEKDIYFRPAGNEAWAEFGGYIWMGENQPAPVADFTQPFTLKFNGTGQASTDASAAFAADVAAIFDAASAPYVASVETATKVFAGRPIADDNSSLKFGTSSVQGSLSFTLAQAIEVDSIIVNATQYGNNAAKVTVNGVEFDLTAGNKKPQDSKITPEGEVSVIAIAQSGTERIYVRNVRVYPKTQGGDPVVVPAKFYVTGNAALVGQDKEWNPSAIKSEADTLELNLEADIDYILKVTVNGTWEGENNVKGYNELTEKTEGLLDLSNDHNIGFKLNEAGVVKVIYKAAAEEQPELFKLVGDFYVAPKVAYYLIGDSAFVVDAGATADKAWTPNAIPCLTDTTVLNLKAGVDYIMRVSPLGTWDNNRDFRHLTDTAAGLIELTDEYGNHSIGFQLAEAGQVTVIYIPAAEEQPEVFKLIGNFYVAPAPDPTVSVFGSMTDPAWKVEVPFTLSDDKTYASLTVENIGAGEYTFKFVINGEWRSNGYTYHRGFPGAAGITENNDADMIFQADQDGEYTFYWYFANDSAAIVYPEYIEPAKEYYAKYAPAWEWVKLTEAEGLWLTDTIVYGGIGININDQAADENNMFYSNTVEEEGVRPIAGAKIDVNDTIYFTFNPADSVVTAVMVGAYVAPDPTASVRLEFMEWAETPFELAEDKQSASLTIENIHHGNYAFKMFINGEWRSNAGTISRENPTAIVAGNEEGNMTLKADVDGEYTFTWFFANDSLVAVFPEKPVVPMTEIRLVPGVWNVDGAKFAAVTWNEGEVMEEGVVSDWFVGTDTVVGNIPAAADSIGFARFNGEAVAPSIEDQSIIWNHTDKMLIDKETMIYTITGWPEEGKDYCPGYWGEYIAPDPTVAVMGSMNNWAEEIPFVLSDDKSYASLTVEHISADNYEFKFVINGEWRSNGYTYHRGFPGAANITENNDANMIFQADVDGEYTFYWYFANDSAAIVYPEIPFACDWNNIAWLDGSNEQIKVCKESEAVGVVNVQKPGWAAEQGIYMTFPSAAWGAISLEEGTYVTEGAGILVYLSALTQEYNEISIVCQDVEYIINIYNAANAPKPDYYLVGTLNKWTALEAFKFGVDETCAEGEYILHATLTAGDEIKVIGILGNDTTWYPAEAGNYNIDDAHAGEAKAIYFRPQYHADWSDFGGYFWIGEDQALLDAPDAAPAAPTYAGYQVHAAYSATYNADCNFGEWGSGTQYTQEEFGKKYVTTNLGYFGLEFTGMDCSEMEALHLDVWVAADASIRIVPIHGGTEVGVTAQLQGQQWNAIDIALTEFAGVTNWSNVYQIKIDNASNLTFWLNNVYFYTTQEKTVDLVDGYYLMGNINGWDIHNLTADHLFAVNPDNEAEYKLHYTLAEGNEFKVVAVANNELAAWYPAEAGNYVVDFAHAGENDIYFRPDYQGGADWHAGCIYVAVDESHVNPWETWFAVGDTWNTETESYLEWDGENQKATIHINVDKYGQWRAQAKYHGPVAEEGKCYHVALKLKANNAISNVTIKYQDNVEMVYVNDAALAANVEFVFDTIVAGLPNGNGIMVLDFGFAHKGDIIEIYDVVIEETECPANRLEDGFYLIGLGMEDWTVDNITADYLFTANPSNEGEYMLNVTLAIEQQFKVVSVANDAIVTWYPDGLDNNYIVDENHYGATTVYFRPDGQGGEGWHYGMIYVAPVDHTAIDNLDANAPAVKIIRDGQILIIKGNKTFNAQGQLVK